MFAQTREMVCRETIGLTARDHSIRFRRVGNEKGLRALVTRTQGRWENKPSKTPLTELAMIKPRSFTRAGKGKPVSICNYAWSCGKRATASGGGLSGWGAGNSPLASRVEAVNLQ
jgi:hypothetical protein